MAVRTGDPAVARLAGRQKQVDHLVRDAWFGYPAAIVGSALAGSGLDGDAGWYPLVVGGLSGFLGWSLVHRAVLRAVGR